LLAILAAIGYSGGVVFNNAYLPEIADEAYHDKLSAKGFSYGYVGSVLLQLICLGLIFGLGGDNPLGPRISFLLVGLWWMGFAQIPIRVLPKGTPIGNGSGHSIWTNGFHELKKVWDQITHTPLLKRFLLSFFFYSMGVQTIMLAAELFAAKEIKKEVDGVWVGLDTAELIIIILLIQLIAIVGANLMARLSAVIGNIKVLMLTVGLWIGICMAAYFTYTAIPFYILAAVVGLVMGGIQSMSRSTFSKMMPETRDTASFFSFYNFVERIAIVIGLFSFGFIEEVTGSMRNSVFALAGFFVIGLILLAWTNRRAHEL
jgi:UMF1 family MFS transporter